MRRTLILIPGLCIAVFAAPAAAPAALSTKGVDKLAAATCFDERREIGRKAFAKKYGERSRGLRACIRRTRVEVQVAAQQAELVCWEELSEWGLQAFTDAYGSDETGWDSMANCIEENADLLLGEGEVEEEVEVS